MLIEQLFDTGLGHASYLCADPDAGVAFLVDPDRHIDAYLAVASRLGVLVTHSFETHVHNDYLSGSRALAELRPITVHTGADASVAYPHVGLAHDEVVHVGELAVRCVATPGHTPEHVAYLVSDLRRADDPQYLFSGGALLVGQIARVDLLGATLEASLARAAYDTLRSHVLKLPDHLAVFPTHGGGSACAATVAGSRWTTLGFERRHNHVARAALEDFGYDDVRGYASPEPDDGEVLRIEQVDARTAAARAEEGAVLLDVREIGEWRDGHASGAVHMPYSEVRERAGELPRGRIVVYCAEGIRSGPAASRRDLTGRG